MTGSGQDYTPRYDEYTSEAYPPDWQSRRRKVLHRDGYICQSCGVRSTRVDDVRFDVDHIVPKSDGGSHALDNLQTLCPSCHADKHTGNGDLRRRARRYKRRNRAPAVVRVVRVLLWPLLAALGLTGDDETILDEHGRRLRVRSLAECASLPEDCGVTVEVQVTELWDSDSDSVQQMGRLADDHTEARFVVWDGDGHPRLQTGGRYRLVGAKTNQYNGDFQLVVDGKTAVQSVEQ
jgi:hypothetical protein